LGKLPILDLSFEHKIGKYKLEEDSHGIENNFQLSLPCSKLWRIYDQDRPKTVVPAMDVNGSRLL
jgi:hypothetical protein